MWIPHLFSTLGVTEWEVKAPTLCQTLGLLSLHKYQSTPDSSEYKQALRWQWYLAGYKEAFFQHLITTIVEQRELC